MENIPLVPRVNSTCDYSTISSLTTQRTALLDILRDSTDSSVLLKTTFQLAMLHSTKEWRHCRNHIFTYFLPSSVGANYADQFVCLNEYTNDFSGLFFGDFCCANDFSLFAGATSCCASQNLSSSSPTLDLFNSSSNRYDSLIFISLNEYLIFFCFLSAHFFPSLLIFTSGCRNPTCIEILSNELIQKSKIIFDPKLGCDAKLTKLLATGDSLDFIYECQLKTVGTDLLGTECQTSADCFYNGTCSLTPNGYRCVHTNLNILTCFQENLDPTIAQYMIFNWGFSNLYAGVNDTW